MPIPTPVIGKDLIYFNSAHGPSSPVLAMNKTAKGDITIACLEAATGKSVFNGKIGKTKSFIASPVASDGKIYIVDEEGTVYILGDGAEFKLLHEIPLNDICLTAPAITEGAIFFRTQNYLIAVGNK